jgi:hypothetical protein
VLLLKSIQHWHHIGNGKALAGYSFTGGAALYASLGMGDEANALLQQLLTGNIGISALLPNTFYVESGGKNPVIETPLSGASAIMDLLLQSWGGKIRVFPAVPNTWQDAHFCHLRAQGGFLVSAQRKAGKTLWVHVKSLAGEPCRLKVADWKGALSATGSRRMTPKLMGNGEYELDLEAGEQFILKPQGDQTIPVIQPIPHDVKSRNLYGVKQGGQLPPGQSWPERAPVSNQEVRK